MERKIVEDLSCRYVIGRKLVTFCKSHSYYVFDEFDLEFMRWGIPLISVEEPDFKHDGVVTEPFRGMLVQYQVDGLKIIEAEVDGRRIVKVEGPRGFVVERVWPHDERRAAASLARRINLLLSVPLERAVEVAVQVVCKEDEECRFGARRWLTLINVWMPDPPIVLKYNKDVEYYRREVDEMFKVWRLKDPDFGSTIIVSLPAVCKRYFITLKGGDTAWGLMCTANKYAHNADAPTIARAGNIYLTPEPLYITAYIEKDELKCMDVGRECIKVIEEGAEERGLAAEEFVGPWRVRVVETSVYKAYYIDDFKLLYVDVNGRAIKLKIPSSLSDVRDLVARLIVSLDEVSRKALLNALEHTAGCAPWHLRL